MLQVSVIEGQKQNADENSDTEAGSSPQATQDDESNKKSEPDDDQMEDSQVAINTFLVHIVILHPFSL